MPRSLNDYLLLRAGTAPDDVAYSFLHQPEDDARTESLTYGGLLSRVTRFSSLLRENLAPGERAVLLYPPGIDYIVAFYSCIWSGVIAVPSYPIRAHHRDQRGQAAITRDCRAVAVLARAEDQPRIEEYCRTFPLNGGSLRILCEPPAAAGVSTASPGPIDNEVAFLQYTSGSTGNPKGVVVSHGNLLHNLGEIQRKFGNDADSRMVSWLPPYHDMGLISAILEPLYAGFPSVLMSPFDFLQKPVRWLHWISKARATVSGGPNFAFDLCVERVGAEQLDGVRLDSLEIMYNGAEPVRAVTLKRFSDLFRRCGFHPRMFYPCYGLSEGTLFVSGGAADDCPVLMRAESCSTLSWEDAHPAGMNGILVGAGETLDRQDMEIVEPRTRVELAPGEEGEIWIRGPSVARGYWDKPDESRSAFGAFTSAGKGPYLRTGDLGRIVDGELFVTGRIKDLIIVRGRKYYPQDIERIVEEEIPSLRPSCSAAFQYPLGRDPVARVALVAEIHRSCRRLDSSRLMESIRQVVGGYFELSLDAIAVVQPGCTLKTSSGKIQRSLTRQRFLAQDLELWASWGDFSGPPAEAEEASAELHDSGA